MQKTIKQIKFIPGYNHPAVGSLFQVTYEDDTQDRVYAETFYIQVKEWECCDESQLIGKSINVEEDYYTY
jgi:hypothetical protein